MSEIIPGKLYLGSVEDACNIQWLSQKSIRTVLTVASDMDEYLTELLTNVNIAHHLFPIIDTSTQSITPLFPSLFSIIDSPGAILVHCMFGISRSATVVLAYLIYKYKMYLDQALAQVLQTRPGIFPNDGFVLQLIAFEKETVGTMSFLPTKDGIQKLKYYIHHFAPVM